MNTAEFMTVAPAPAPAPVAAPSSRPATGSRINRRSTELVATFFGEVVWSSNDGDNPRTIFRVNHRGASVACIAGVLPDQLEDEQTYRFLGRWEESKYGPQFQVSTYIIDVPISAAGVVKYLTTFAPSLGKSAAGKLLAKYGADAVQVLRETPERVHADCVLSLSQAKTAAKELAAGAATELTKLELFGLLDKRGFRREIYDRLIGKWGVKAPGIIRRDPYRLLTARMPGAGFKRTDKLWVDLGLPRDAIKRQTICGWAALQNDRTGHTWFRESEVKDKIEETIRGDGCDPVRAITLGVRAGWFEQHIDAKGLVWLAEASKARDERRISHAINCLLAGPNHWPADLPVSAVEGDGLPSEHQRERALRAVSKPVGILAGGPGTGKAMPLGTKILTPHGWMEIGAAMVGDMVFGSDGLPHKITGVFPQGEKQIYRVTFNDGASVECCGEHLWLTETRSDRKSSQKTGKKTFSNAMVRNTEEILSTLLSDDNHTNHYIPLVAPIQFDKQDHIVDPYVLGVLLGDGHIGKDCVGWTNPNIEIAESVRELTSGQVAVVKRARAGRCDTYALIGGGEPGYRSKETNKTLNEMRRLGLAGKLAHEKHIPDSYKFDCVENRIAILQGLLDTDGSVEKCNIEYCTTSPRLANDVRFLVESLGGTVSVTWRFTSFTYKGGKKRGRRSARILVKLPPHIEPFRLSVKASKYTPRTKYKPYRQIVDVELVGIKQAQCISVDSDDSLYVTEHCILTHNTHTLAYVLRELLRTHSSSDIAVVAPTGKAAVRATQSLDRIGLGALRATTIHSLLEIGRNGHDGDGWGFLRNATNPLDCRFVIVDESSMIDANLLACLLDACKRPTVQKAEVVDEHGEVVSEAKVATAGTHVLFIGDPGQLSPVGHGAPLRDLIASGSLGFGELSEVRRNAGQIVHACQRIRAGKDFETSQRLDLTAEPPMNLKLIEVRSESQAVAALEQAVQAITKWDRVWQTQIIVPLNTKGQLSRIEINKRLRKLLNPDGHSVPGMPFSVGDKVVCLRNSWIPVARISPWAARDGASSMDATKYRKDGDKEQYVANGEIGRVIAIATGVMILQMDGKPPIRVPVGKQRATEEDGAGGSGSGSGGSDDSGAGQGCSFDHAYALTAHKMQGSETPLAIVMADSAADTVAGREWWYTAISRAAQACIIIGSPEVIDRQSKKAGLSRRKTFLRELLEDVL